jgi:squalene-hopene/tetraprenyl-beta-curcumene cyclase
MGELGYLDPAYKKIIKKALGYLMKSQRDDGSWYGRWGVTFIYGTSKVLQALEVLENRGFSTNGHRKRTLDAMDWLVSCQNSDGGWGEDCRSFDQDSYCPLGRSTASQTAWALLGIMGDKRNKIPAEMAIDYLIGSQEPDGSWSEDYYTGGGFPGTFYLRYEFYKDYFPLMALGKYRSEK